VRFEWGERGLRALAQAARVFVWWTCCASRPACRWHVRAARRCSRFPWKDARVAAYAAERRALVAGAGERYSLSPASLAGSPRERGSCCVAEWLGALVRGGGARRGPRRLPAQREARSRARGRAGRPVAVIAAASAGPTGACARARGQLGAGAVIARLPGTLSPEARHARAAFELASRDLEARCAAARRRDPLLDTRWANDLRSRSRSTRSGRAAASRRRLHGTWTRGDLGERACRASGESVPEAAR